MNIYFIKHGDLLSVRAEHQDQFCHHNIESVPFDVLRALGKDFNNDDNISAMKVLFPTTSRIDCRTWLEKCFKELVSLEVPYDSRVHFFDLGERIHPIHVIAEITSKCNMHCAYCYGRFGDSLTAPVDKTSWVSLFEKVEIKTGLPVQLLNITGGEPSIYPDVDALISATSGRFGLSYFTNLLHLEQSTLNALIHHQSLVRVNVSFDSHAQEIDQRLRGQGHKRRMENLIRLCHAGLSITINIGVSSVNADTLGDSIDWFVSEVPGAVLRLGRIDNQGRAVSLEEGIVLDRPRYRDLMTSIKSQYDESVNLIVEEYGQQPSMYRCNAGFGSIVINSKGELKPCQRPDEFFTSLSSSKHFLCDLLNTTKDELLDSQLFTMASKQVPVETLVSGCVFH
jgi:MoaA/NifB/PqqE/SkfB family radical SAM enzyme